MYVINKKPKGHYSKTFARGKAVCTVHKININLLVGTEDVTNQSKTKRPILLTTAIHLRNYDTDMLHNIRF